MLWTLYRYQLIDLLRIIGLTTAVLVTVAAFGAALKPLAKNSLDAIQTAKYLGLAIVPMLQFALPFAAGFGATLSLYRMTTDNEIQAMAASGISYRRILLPIAGLGVVLALVMVILTQTVIPHFWSMIVQTFAKDFTRMFQASIERGEPFQLDRLQIYADRLAVEHQPEGENGPTTRMFLVNMAAAELDSQQRVVTDVTASRALVDVYRRQTGTFIKLVMIDAVALQTNTGHLARSDRIAPPRAIELPSTLVQSPKGMTRSQLLALRDNPDEYPDVARERQSLADLIAEIELRNILDEQLRTDGKLELTFADSQPDEVSRTVTIYAERMNNDGRFISSRDEPIQIVQVQGGVPTLKFLTDWAQLTAAASQESAPAVFDLTLGNHDVINLRDSSGAANRRGRLVIPNLEVSNYDTEALIKLSSDQLLDRAADINVARERVRQRVSRLRQEINSLQNEITGRLLNRYALSVTALLLLLLGSVLAIWRRGSLPLSTYALAFLPSLIDLILISAGEQLIRDGKSWGHFVMWSGNAALLLMLMISYARLSRN